MAPELNKEAEEVLEVFTEYLNLWHAEDKEYYGADYQPVNRAMYDEFDDPPVILHDHSMGTEVRIIMIQANPFHDEGGPNVLTAFFNLRQGIDWSLDFVVQQFDTTYEVVYNDGKLRVPDGYIERG